MGEVIDALGLGGRERPGIEGLELLWGWLPGVADWKSSKSSSSLAPLDCIEPKASSIVFGAVRFPLEVKSFGGVCGGTSSASKLKISTSGSFFFGGGGFWASRRMVEDEGSVFRRAGLAVPASSYSSYSSNLSRRLLES